MSLQFRKVETPAGASDGTQPESFLARTTVTVGCGHEVEVTFALTPAQLAQLGADYLAGTAPPAREIVERMMGATMQMAPQVKCAACRERVVN